MRVEPDQDLVREAMLDAASAHCARSGDASAFESLIRKYHARVYQFVLRRGASGSDAEDLTQETFLRAWRAIGSFDPGGQARFSTWLFTIAARLASTHARDSATARRALQKAARNRPGAAVTPPPAVDFDLWALADDVLGDETRTAMWLRYAEDLSPEEIALVLERSGVSVRVMLFRGRARLARALEKMGVEGISTISKVDQERCHA